MPKRALITGIAGQDGSYLAELLLDKGYEVHGAVRPQTLADESALTRLSFIRDRLSLHPLILDQQASVASLVQTVQPDECYHFSAVTDVSYDAAEEIPVTRLNVLGTHLLLSDLHLMRPQCRICVAGSAEMFGNVVESPQRETTPLRPRSAYGVSKIAAFHLTSVYRHTHGMHASTAILYNHESPRRGHHFVTRKISRAAAAIKYGQQEKLLLGNLDAIRDWGYAPEYVQAMWRMVQQDPPDDFILATGKGSTVRSFVECAFASAGLDWTRYVGIDPQWNRPAELLPLVGDPAKAAEKLGWRARKTVPEIAEEMVQHDLALLNQQLGKPAHAG